MKVLEERLMYLFIVFCKDLLCIPNSILAQGLSFVRYIFCFPPSHTLFSILFLGLLTFRSQCFTWLSPLSTRMMLLFRDFESLAYVLRWRFCLIVIF